MSWSPGWSTACGPLAERRGCALLTHLPLVACPAEVDPRRVERIVRNLVGNAIEHGEAKPVEIVVAADSLAVAVSVRDHGVGLREDELALVFNRFWRADPARARSTGGTGLGLAIALEDAHLHDGWLEVWGRPGRGRLLPADPAAAVPGSCSASSPLPLIPDDVGPAVGASALVGRRPVAERDRPRGRGPCGGGQPGGGWPVERALGVTGERRGDRPTPGRRSCPGVT